MLRTEVRVTMRAYACAHLTASRQLRFSVSLSSCDGVFLPDGCFDWLVKADFIGPDWHEARHQASLNGITIRVRISGVFFELRMMKKKRRAAFGLHFLLFLLLPTLAGKLSPQRTQLLISFQNLFYLFLVFQQPYEESARTFYN
jgi:hypothetical protein